MNKSKPDGLDKARLSRIPGKSLWKKIEARWPAEIRGVPASYAAIRRDVEQWLFGAGIVPLAFSHFGAVVRDKDAVAVFFKGQAGDKIGQPRTDWVAALGLYVMRADCEGTEIEWIAPVHQSFFFDHLRKQGESLHHASFRVKDIDESLTSLTAAGVALLTEKPLAGSHGRILFARPSEFAPLCIELCQTS